MKITKENIGILLINCPPSLPPESKKWITFEKLVTALSELNVKITAPIYGRHKANPIRVCAFLLTANKIKNNVVFVTANNIILTKNLT